MSIWGVVILVVVVFSFDEGLGALILGIFVVAAFSVLKGLFF